MIVCDRSLGELEGAMAAWRNLLWDSVRMLQAGRPDLAGRFRAAAGEVEQGLRAMRAVGADRRAPAMAATAPAP